MNVEAGLFGATISWKEEVLLHDGGILVVERFYNLGGYPTLDSRERAALDETVTFSLTGTDKQIIWKTDFRDSVPEPNSLNLLLLDVVKGVPYIAPTRLDVSLTTSGNDPTRRTFFSSMRAMSGSRFR